MVGLDPLKFLDCRDELEIQKMQEVAQRIHKMREVELQNLAKYIAREVSSLFPKRSK